MPILPCTCVIVGDLSYSGTLGMVAVKKKLLAVLILNSTFEAIPGLHRHAQTSFSPIRLVFEFKEVKKTPCAIIT